MAKESEIELAYSNAIRFTKSHYENFPVLSVFVPKALQKHVAVVYQFARQADDLADEGKFTEAERIENLFEYENDFVKSLSGVFKNQFWMALANTIIAFNLTQSNFKNLLIAFRQDVTKSDYQNLDELLNYCKYSANPVGRIILELHRINNTRALEYSDSICTGLQLTNFLQDVAVDYEKGRVYLPQEDIKKHKVDLKLIKSKKMDANFQELIKSEIEIVKSYFNNGKKLLQFLPFGLRQQIRWTIGGGIGILSKIENINYDVINKRPVFSKLDFIKLLLNMKI